MRITVTLLAITASLLSLPSMAQDWAPGFYEDRELFESGGGAAGGGVCMHALSVVDKIPLLRDFEPNYDDLVDNEIIVEILAESYEQRVVQAASTALEKYGFVRVGGNLYELPDSSLCFLKMYRSDSPNGITFIPFFKNPLERCDTVFSTQYDPIAFEQTLVEELIRFGVNQYAELDYRVYLFHPPIRVEVNKCE